MYSKALMFAVNLFTGEFQQVKEKKPSSKLRTVFAGNVLNRSYLKPRSAVDNIGHTGWT